MDVVAAFLIGYVLGIRQGPNEYGRLMTSLRAVLGSEEVRSVSTAVITRAAERMGRSNLAMAILEGIVSRWLGRKG